MGWNTFCTRIRIWPNIMARSFVYFSAIVLYLRASDASYHLRAKNHASMQPSYRRDSMHPEILLQLFSFYIIKRFFNVVCPKMKMLFIKKFTPLSTEEMECQNCSLLNRQAIKYKTRKWPSQLPDPFTGSDRQNFWLFKKQVYVFFFSLALLFFTATDIWKTQKEIKPRLMGLPYWNYGFDAALWLFG